MDRWRIPCVCGHLLGDHRGGMEAIRRGYCRECDCTEYRRAYEPEPPEKDAA